MSDVTKAMGPAPRASDPRELVDPQPALPESEPTVPRTIGGIYAFISLFSSFVDGNEDVEPPPEIGRQIEGDFRRFLDDEAASQGSIDEFVAARGLSMSVAAPSILRVLVRELRQFIPDSLYREKRWIGFKFVHEEGKQKLSKKPYSLADGRACGAISKNQARFLTFPEAFSAAPKK